MSEGIKGKKITDLEEKTELTDADLFVIGNGGTASLKRIMWGNILGNIVEKILGKITDRAHPIGSLYFTVTNNNPKNFLGGTWELWGAGRTIVGFDAADPNFNTAEKMGGEKTHKLTEEEMPGHSHTVQSHTHSIAAHSHGLNSHTHGIPALTGTAASNGAHKHVVPHSADASTSGSGARMYGYDADGKTTADYSNRYTSNTGAHAHTVTTKAATTGSASGSTANSAAATSGATEPGTSEVGGNKAHSNLQPYIICYIWKRIA